MDKPLAAGVGPRTSAPYRSTSGIATGPSTKPTSMLRFESPGFSVIGLLTPEKGFTSLSTEAPIEANADKTHFASW